MCNATTSALAVVGIGALIVAGALLALPLVARVVSWVVEGVRWLLGGRHVANVELEMKLSEAKARDAVESMPRRVLVPLQPSSKTQAVPQPQGDVDFRDPRVQALVNTRKWQVIIGGPDVDDGGVPA